MRALIVYASTHHGNTRKVVEAISKAYQIEMVDATALGEKDLSDYGMIVLASGIYGGMFHKAIQNFAVKNLPNGNVDSNAKKIFYVMTSAMNKDFSKFMNQFIAGKNVEVVGSFSCTGYNTFGPFKLIGGTGKGHPDEKDLQDAVEAFGKVYQGR